jgi:hypothetical protein
MWLLNSLDFSIAAMKIHLVRSIFPILTSVFLLMGVDSAVAAIRFIPPLPPDQGYPPGSIRGGASRGDCLTVATQLTALAPTAIEPMVNGSVMESVWGLTTADRPTFWFYVPYSLTDDRPGEFVLLDADHNYVYQSPPIRSAEAGIIQITLPSSVSSLEIGKRYQWTFMIYCETDNPVFTQGSIERIAATAALSAQLARSTPSERAVLFASNGIWYDALTTLAELYFADPHDQAIESNWQSLMQSVGLPEMSNQPLLRRRSNSTPPLDFGF